MHIFILWRSSSLEKPQHRGIIIYLHLYQSHRDLNLKFFLVAETPISVTSFLPTPVPSWCSESLVSCSLASTTPLCPSSRSWLSYCAPKSRDGQFWRARKMKTCAKDPWYILWELCNCAQILQSLAIILLHHTITRGSEAPVENVSKLQSTAWYSFAQTDQKVCFLEAIIWEAGVSSNYLPYLSLGVSSKSENVGFDLFRVRMAGATVFLGLLPLLVVFWSSFPFLGFWLLTDFWFSSMNGTHAKWLWS